MQKELKWTLRLCSTRLHGLATDAGKIFRKILIDRRAKASDRLIAAELAGNFTVINDELAGALLAIVRDASEPEGLRARAAISFGPALEQADLGEFEDPDEVPITEGMFHNIQDSLQKIYLDHSTPKEVRRRILEASVRAPRPGTRMHRAGICQRRQEVDADGCVRDALGPRF